VVAGVQEGAAPKPGGVAEAATAEEARIAQREFPPPAPQPERTEPEPEPSGVEMHGTISERSRLFLAKTPEERMLAIQAIQRREEQEREALQARKQEQERWFTKARERAQREQLARVRVQREQYEREMNPEGRPRIAEHPFELP
jgi:hypothetical protein